ncbi:CAAX geranylgeranyltransferase alpha subunit [Pichia californica]|uniref:Protein farnesyltransferase/geranylgeranyltransferase type-1 subunit alpha n=1 Tax=Pichia californica TaxID=460514 RepID=A0A9P6WI11_9ASCO|nr:CAAX geranylgeranyltransferase alpha subunit [[Candida] californica]
MNTDEYNFDDIIPLEDGAPEGLEDIVLCKIMYTDEFKMVFSYLRALMAKNEYSKRSNYVACYAISLVPAHYTVWNYKFDIVKSLYENGEYSINEEFKWCNKIALENEKNYQIWQYRELLIKLMIENEFNDDKNKYNLDHEYEIINKMLDSDEKNYHVWSHKRWIVEYFNLFHNLKELENTEILLERDVRNNSVWNFRNFINFKDDDVTNNNNLIDIIVKEVDFTISKIKESITNPSSWNYFKHLYNLSKESITDETLDNKKLEECISKIKKIVDDYTCSAVDVENKLAEKSLSVPAFELLADMYRDDGCHQEMVTVCSLLGEELDPSQLVEIAEDLAIDIAECKVKKDIYETVRDYFYENADQFDENSKYYELAVLSKFGSPKKTVFIESDNGDVNEVDIIEEDDEDDETEEAEEAEDAEEAAGENDDDDDEEVDDEDDEDDEEYEYDEELDFDYTPPTLLESIKEGTLYEYIEDKNDEVKDYLTDPYSINELVFFFETFAVLKALTSTTLDSYLPDSVSEYVPKFILSTKVISKDSFTLLNLSIVLLWTLVGKILPVIISNYINFTYDFDRDAFVESLAKLFIAIVVFKSDISLKSIGDEFKFSWTLNATVLSYFKHYIFQAALSLRGILNNWVLVDALFTSILALYANLAFV